MCLFFLLSFSSCSKYETQPWSWRQDGGYPYYSDLPPPATDPRLKLPSIPVDSSSSCTNDAAEQSQSNKEAAYTESNCTLTKSFPQERTPPEQIHERLWDEILFSDFIRNNNALYIACLASFTNCSLSRLMWRFSVSGYFSWWFCYKCICLYTCFLW